MSNSVAEEVHRHTYNDSMWPEKGRLDLSELKGSDGNLFNRGRFRDMVKELAKTKFLEYTEGRVLFFQFPDERERLNFEAKLIESFERQKGITVEKQ